MKHIEDLSISDFIKTVRNLRTMVATEKLDGSNLWMGLDETGKLYTTRAGKKARAKKVYSEDEYPHLSTVDPFRAAHVALKAKEDDIKSVMQPGQEVEVEVLFGRQPNAVTYGAEGKSYIAFIRGVNGTPDIVADQLAALLGHTSVSVSVDITDTSDGEALSVTKQEIDFKFVSAQKVNQNDLAGLDLEPKLKELEEFLAKPANLEGFDLTNFDMLTRSLGSIPMAYREEAKALKAEITTKVLSDFKLPIKKDLLNNFVSKIKSNLSSDDLNNDEDVGVEGVVLRDPTSGEQFKIVDKDTFTTINQFNQAMRAAIGGVVKTLDAEAPIEMRGGVVGDLKIHIADLLGNKELARGAGARKVFAAMNGTDEVDTIKKFATNLQIDDFQGTKRKILALISAAHTKLGNMLSDFKTNKDHYHLKLKNGKTVGLSDGTVKKTLLSFAESRRDLLELFEKAKVTKTLPQLLAVLYGRAVKTAHADKLSESILTETRYDNDKARYRGKDAWTLLNIYLATLFMSVLMYKINDKKGLKLLKDKAHYKMSGWHKDMSPLNFWGYVIWKASTPAVKKLIGNKTAQSIFKVTRRIPPNHIKMLHMDLSFGRDVPIDWAEHVKTLKILRQFDGLNIDRINSLMTDAFTYETLSFDAKVKFITKLLYYVQQFVPTSPLLVRLKVINNNLLVNANGENDLMVQEATLLKSIVNMVETAPDGAVTAGDIPSVPMRLGTSRPTIKMTRNPAVKRKKFERPKTSNKE